jgi:hypothetical protein
MAELTREDYRQILEEELSKIREKQKERGQAGGDGVGGGGASAQTQERIKVAD